MQQPGATIQLKQLVQLRTLARDLSHQHRPLTTSSGTYLSRQRGRGMDFDAVRRYQAGDEIRHIDWNVTARTDKVHTKLFCEERECPIFLIVDLNSSMLFGTRNVFKSVLAAELAAIVAWSSIKQGDRVGGLIQTATNTQSFKAKARQAGVLPLLKALSTECKTTSHYGSHSLNPLLQSTHKLARPSAIIYIFSDFYGLDNLGLKSLVHLAKCYTLNLNFIYDPLEQSVPPADYYRFSDGQQDHLVNLHNPTLRERYLQPFRQRKHVLEQFSGQHSVKLFEFSTAEDIKSHATKLHHTR